VVEVHCDEGVANHIGPEPCVRVRESMGEASVGGAREPAIEPRKNLNPDADVVHRPEGKTDGARDRECPGDPAWSLAWPDRRDT
jgi:hypothetical protein